MTTQPHLPSHTKLDIAALSKLFVNTASTYKFLWTLAILQIIKFANANKNAAQQTADGWRQIMDAPVIAVKYAATGLQVKVADIILLMLEIAKPPLNNCMLAFGEGDKMKAHLDDLANGDTTESAVCHALAALVPHRWLAPFLEPDTQSKKITDIRAAASARFAGNRPAPYKFVDLTKYILIHPDWLAYFSANNSILDGWTRWHWAIYLQKKNPNIPAIISKIAAPEKSLPTLAPQRAFWRDVMKNARLSCVYSARPLSPADMDRQMTCVLDHFVPRDFVGHDNLWNLVPVFPATVESKRNQLPHVRYLHGFIARHHLALTTRRQYFPDRHTSLVDAYLTDLKLQEADLQDSQKLTAAYQSIVPTFITLAAASGFKSDWVYSQPQE